MRLAAIFLICLLSAACSRSDADKLKGDTQALGHDLAGDVRKLGDNPDLKAAGDQLKMAAHDTGQNLRKAGQDISHHSQAAVNDTQGATDR